MKTHLLFRSTLFFVLMILFSVSEVFGQQTVSGTVTDANNSELLPGVNILVKGTSQGTTTDAEGSYELSVTSPSDTLVFSFVGYSTQEVPVEGRSEIDVQLSPQAFVGDDIVVVGYGTQRENQVTGAIGRVGSEELEVTPSVTTSDALVGTIEGITSRKSDARPGSSASLQIRNLGQPLYVIDGVPSSASDFNNLGQGDIEDISILKDASAAVYGMRASNGVVLVTTKSGGYNNDTQVDLSGYYGFQNFTRYPRPGNAYQYIRGKVESAQNYGNPSPYSPEELQNWKEGGGDYKSYDYYDMVMKPFIPQWQIKGSVSGGSDNVSYFLSATHLNEDALIKDYNWNRTNIQANIEGTISQGLTLGAQISTRVEDRHNVGVPGLDDYFNPFLSIFTMWPTEAPYANDNPNYVAQTHNVNVNPATYTEDITGYVDEIYRTANVNLFAEYDFDFGLALKGTASYKYRSFHANEFEFTYDAYQYDEETDTYFTQPGWGNNNPWRDKKFDSIINRFAQLQANYSQQYGDHFISALAAYERQDNNNTYLNVNTVPPNNYIPYMELADMNFMVHDIGKEARAGYVGKFNYNYKEKYILEILGRYDGSFLFPEDNRWGLFPAASVGWRISEEPFFEENVGDFITDLKIRASYGVTGSDTWGNGAWIIAPFSYRSGYNYNVGSAIFDGENVPGLDPISQPVTNLSWIKNYSRNIGLDISFFDDQLSASLDIFERRREGLPAARYDVRLPSLVGFSLPPENLESDARRGIEGSVKYMGRISEEISFVIGGNATLSRPWVLDRYKPRFGNSWDEYRNGLEDRYANNTWGYQVIGRFQSEEQIEGYPVNVDGQGNRTLLPGDFIYKDVNEDGVINWLDERPIGYSIDWGGANPQMSFGLNGSFSYKGAKLTYNFAGGAMQSFMRNWELRYHFQNNGNSPAFMLEDRWHREDPFDPDSEWIPGDYPAIREAYYGHSNDRTNDYWVHNIKYFRLKNLQISYTLPQDLVGRIGMDRLTVYAQGTNLFSLDNTRKYDIDPEVAAHNGLQYPRQRLFNFGFNISL